ncbi:unnamed protein product [Pedinophyceae sp. YPF-701]|nr:unnamed protein product [Pedinophyceae sp. YPF-701]
MTNALYDVLVIGAGPSAYTAALYAARNNRKVLVCHGMGPSGQLSSTKEVENFPSYPDGIMGPDLVYRCYEQATKCGAETKDAMVTRLRKEADGSFAVTAEPTDGTAAVELQARTVIVASGADARRLGCPGEEQYWTKGVSACAVCDGALPIFRNKPVLVIGGGDTAMEEAMHMTRYASKTYVVHRRDQFRASAVMQKRVLGSEKIEVVWDSVLEEICGDGNLCKSAKVKNVKTGEVTEIECAGVFFAIGHTPNTQFLRDSGAEFAKVLDSEAGHMIVQPGTSITAVDGLFASGDVADKRYRQAITAAGSGCMGALDAEHYLSARD